MPRNPGRVAVFAVALATGVATFVAPARPAAQQRAPTSPQPAAPTTGTGAISGIVVDAATGRPLAGAIVSLLSTGRGRSTVPIRPQATDGQGRFIFTNLPASDGYQLSSSRIGYVDAAFGAINGPRELTRVALAPGQWISDLRIELSKLMAINGTVVDETSEPVVGAYVRALSRVYVAGNVHVASSLVTRTDDRGAYRIAGLSPGNYLVMVPSVQWAVPVDAGDADLGLVLRAGGPGGAVPPPRADPAVNVDGRSRWIMNGYSTPAPAANGTLSAYPITFYPAARMLGEAATVELRKGEDRSGVNIQIAPARTYRISGTVEGPPDANAKGMSLRLMAAGLEGLGIGGETGTSLVAADGSFTFVNVPAGDYTILASRETMEYSLGSRNGTMDLPLPRPPGRQSGGTNGGGTLNSAVAGLEYHYSNSQDNTGYSGRAHATVSGSDVNGVVVTLRPGSSISGRIVQETTAQQLPSAGQAMPATGVQAMPATGDPTLGMVTSRMTGDGPSSTFQITNLPGGGYQLRILSNGTVKSIIWNGEDYTYKPFDASLGRDFTDVVITITDKAATLAGTVRNAQGVAVSRGAALIFPVEPDQWSGYGFTSRRIFGRQLGNDGTYRSGPLPAGEYFLVAIDDTLRGAWQDPKFLELASRQATRVTVGWGETKTQDLVLKQVK